MHTYTHTLKDIHIHTYGNMNTSTTCKVSTHDNAYEELLDDNTLDDEDDDELDDDEELDDEDDDELDDNELLLELLELRDDDDELDELDDEDELNDELDELLHT
jgi:hypothetical protein